MPVLADVGNRVKLRQVFERYRPGVVFHAAAYKHVPLMEANPVESVRNNVLATRTIADVAAEFGAERFVLVSTDKAVEPEDGDGPVEGALRVGSSRRTATAPTCRPASSPSASATCSAPRGA